jgi:hypothetical protein
MSSLRVYYSIAGTRKSGVIYGPQLLGRRHENPLTLRLIEGIEVRMKT